MILFPAIDLKDGACVRLHKGDMGKARVFSEDPGAQARTFADAGCQWLHVVDLDGAFAGKPVNVDAVSAILDAVDIPVQLGGGMRDLDIIGNWLDKGVERAIIGTAAVRNPDMVLKACEKFPGRIAVAVDARGGRAATDGWVETSQAQVRDMAMAFEQTGVVAMIYTDISRDGTLEGINAFAIETLARSTTTPVIASGGVASLADLEAIKRIEHAGVVGVIVGLALYDGRIDLGEALAAVSG